MKYFSDVEGDSLEPLCGSINSNLVTDSVCGRFLYFVFWCLKSLYLSLTAIVDYAPLNVIQCQDVFVRWVTDTHVAEHD